MRQINWSIGDTMRDEISETRLAARPQLPAYGKQILEARKRGLQPRQQLVLVTFNWNLAKAFPRLVVDPVSDFDSLDFSYLVGLDTIIGFTQVEANMVEPLARAILRSHPRRLQAWPLEPDVDGRFPTRFFKTANGSAYEQI